LGAVFLALSSTASAQCILQCSSNTQPCFANAEDIVDCLGSIPFSQDWANATLDVLLQSLENFGFKELYHSTGPPYSISLDVLGELSDTYEMMPFINDLLFQEHVQQS